MFQFRKNYLHLLQQETAILFTTNLWNSFQIHATRPEFKVMPFIKFPISMTVLHYRLGWENATEKETGDR